MFAIIRPTGNPNVRSKLRPACKGGGTDAFADAARLAISFKSGGAFDFLIYIEADKRGGGFFTFLSVIFFARKNIIKKPFFKEELPK